MSARRLQHNPHFIPLGHIKDQFFFRSKITGQLICLYAAHLERMSTLLTLAPMNFWESLYSDFLTNARGHDLAASDLIHVSYDIGELPIPQPTQTDEYEGLF